MMRSSVTVKSEDELDISDRPFTKTFPEFSNNFWFPDTIQFVTHARLDHTDMKRACNEPFRLGMLSDKYPDDSRPSSQYVGFPDTGVYAELWKKLSKHLPNQSGTIGSYLSRKSPPLLQNSLCASPFFGVATLRCRYSFFRQKICTPILGVVANCLDRAAFHGFLAKRLFLWSLRLLVDVGVPPVVIAGEICRCSLATQIAIDTLIVAVICTCNILWILVGYVSHD